MRLIRERVISKTDRAFPSWGITKGAKYVVRLNKHVARSNKSERYKAW